MIWGFFVLAACQLVGEVLRGVLHLPVPGPVIGMFLLTALLVARQAGRGASEGTSLDASAEALIRFMGLLFVPAGAGVVAEMDLLRSAWLPLVAALAGSTLLGLVTTGLTMHWLMTSFDRRAARRLSARHPDADLLAASAPRRPTHDSEHVHD